MAEEARPEPKLRHVETDVLIPKIMREKARDLCSEHVQAPLKGLEQLSQGQRGMKSLSMKERSLIRATNSRY